MLPSNHVTLETPTYPHLLSPLPFLLTSLKEGTKSDLLYVTARASIRCNCLHHLYHSSTQVVFTEDLLCVNPSPGHSESQETLALFS